jgi:hypothetical protein
MTGYCLYLRNYKNLHPVCQGHLENEKIFDPGSLPLMLVLPRPEDMSHPLIMSFP